MMKNGRQVIQTQRQKMLEHPEEVEFNYLTMLLEATRDLPAGTDIVETDQEILGQTVDMIGAGENLFMPLLCFDSDLNFSLSKQRI